MDIADFIAAAGSPLELSAVFDPEERQLISELTARTVAQAQANGEGTAVAATILGLYAHAFYVGRDHALSGAALPVHARRGLSGLTAQNLSGIIIPDDISSL